MPGPVNPPADDFQIRCPRLGHLVAFPYCRHENGGAPCAKILDCWFVHFDVAGYLEATLPGEEWRRLATPGTPNKVASLLDLIERARRSAKEPG